jgi:hypothetical protein
MRLAARRIAMMQVDDSETRDALRFVRRVLERVEET